MATVSNSKQALTMLKGSLLFKNCAEPILQQIAKELKEVNYKKGDPIFLENEASRQVYFVQKGSIEIVKMRSDRGQADRVKLAKAGDYFSEFSVLTSSDHTTSAFAVENSTLLALDQKPFLELLNRHPAIAKNIAVVLARINQQLTNSSNYIEYFKESQFSLVPEMIKALPHHFITRFKALPIRLEMNTLLVAMQDPNDKEFFEAFASMNSQIHLRVSVIGEKDFDRLKKKVSLFYSGYDVDIAKKAKDGGDTDEAESEDGDIRRLLKYTTFFSRLNDALIDQLVPLFQLKEFQPDENIFKPGTPSNYLYLIRTGAVELVKILPSGGETHVVTLSKNDNFAEISLLTNSSHSLLARAAGKTQIYLLEKNVFQKLLDTPHFSVPLAGALAQRLQELNRMTQLDFYTGPVTQQIKELSKILPPALVREHQVIPLALKEGALTLGMVNPENDQIYAIINRYLHEYRIKIVAIREDDLEKWLGQLAKGPKAEIPISNTPGEASPATPPGGGATAGQKTMGLGAQTDAVKVLEKIISAGIKNRASDIHIEPQADNFIVRYRVDGSLRELHERPDASLGSMLVNRTKVLSEMDISEKRLPQDGQLKVKMKGGEVQARISTMPTKFGEKLVVRIMEGKKSAMPLNMIAADRQTGAFLQDIIRHRQGVFLITGPTGSGKTTTLYSALNELNSVDMNIVTAEDPVELVIPGLTQVEINDQIDFTFKRVLRSFLRQDPDIIMIGEIRDSGSAQIAFEAALTGHLVLSTLHTNTSLDIVPRLKELGVSATTIGSGLIGAMAQRLIPKNCTHCKGPVAPTEREQEALKSYFPEGALPEQLIRGKGCPKCANTGFLGRIAVFESWKKTSSVRRLLMENCSVEELEVAVRKDNFHSLSETAVHLVRMGLTSIDQVERHLYGMAM